MYDILVNKDNSLLIEKKKISNPWKPRTKFKYNA